MRPTVLKILACLLITARTGAGHSAELSADPPKDCDSCADWNQPLEPFRIWANTWYVGTKGLSAILITSKDGHILIDGGLPQSAPQIAAHIETAGFHLKDVKLILNSHTHFDHAGGIAALQRASGAPVSASPKSQIALERGGPTEEDPQFAFGAAQNDYAPVSKVIAIRDGGTARVGSLTVTAHFTPGHTPGGTSWTWSACDGEDCRSVVYADSLNAVAAPGFRFSDHPDVVADLLRSIDTVANLECDILLAPHPEFFDRDGKLAARTSQHDFNSFVNRGECRSYADAARQRLEKRLIDERH
jgi:metallo-beta-lactamase class B